MDLYNKKGSGTSDKGCFGFIHYLCFYMVYSLRIFGDMRHISRHL